MTFFVPWLTSAGSSFRFLEPRAKNTPCKCPGRVNTLKMTKEVRQSGTKLRLVTKDPASDMTHAFGEPMARTSGEKFPKSIKRWLEKEQFLN